MYAKYTKFSHTYAINYSYSNYILKYSIEIVNILSQFFVIFVKNAQDNLFIFSNLTKNRGCHTLNSSNDGNLFPP